MSQFGMDDADGDRPVRLPSQIFRRGGLTLDNWILIGRFLYPEDLITLRGTNKMLNRLFPHLIQILMDLWITKVGSEFPLAELETDMMNFFIGPTYERVLELKSNYSEGMEQFLAKISDKRFVKPIWRPYIEGILLLLRCYESIQRGRAKANLGWWYDDSIFGSQAFDRNQHENFQKIKYWFGGLDSKKKVRGKAVAAMDEAEEQAYGARSQTAKVFSRSDFRKYYSVGKGSAFEDWTWLDFRELEPSLCGSYLRYTEFLRQLLAQKRRSQEAMLLESAGTDENSASLTNLTAEERTAHVDKIRKREQDRKAAYGTLDEPPDELVEVGTAACAWVYEAITLFNRSKEAITHCRFLLSYLAVAQMGMAVLEFTEPQMLVLNSARFLTRSLFSLRRSHLTTTDVELAQLIFARGDPTPTGIAPPTVMQRVLGVAPPKDTQASKKSKSVSGGSTTSSSATQEDFLAQLKTKQNFLKVQSAGYQVPSVLVLRTLAPRPYLNDFRYAEGGTVVTKFSALGAKFRKHARRTYVAIQVANMFNEWYERHNRNRGKSLFSVESFAPGSSANVGGSAEPRDPNADAGSGEKFALRKKKPPEVGKYGFEYKPKRPWDPSNLYPAPIPRVSFLDPSGGEDESMQNSKRKQNLNKPPSRENANNKLPSFKHLQGGQITPAVSSVTGHLPHVIEGPTSRASSSSSTRWRQTGPAKSELDMLIETTKRDMSYGDMVRRSASKEEADAEQESNASSSKEAGGAAGQSSSQLQTIVENVMKEDPAATAEELSDLVTAAVIENSLNQLADAENAEVRVGQDLLEVSLQEAMDRLLQEDRESVRGDDSRPSTANVSQHQSAQMNKTSTNTSKSKQNKPSMSQMRVSFYPETVPETIAREYKETEDYRDRILTLGSHLGPYARGHLVTAENNDSVNTVLNTRKGGKKARKPIKSMVDLYVLPKLYPTNAVGQKAGRQVVGTRQNWSTPGQREVMF